MERTTENFASTSRGTPITFRAPGTQGRQQFKLTVGAPVIDEEDPVDHLEELLGQTWTIFGVSALFGFQTTELYLKLYAKRLREQVASILTQENVAYDAKISIMEDVTPRPDPADPPPIKVEVYAITGSGEESINKCIYKGILLSWRTTRNESDNGNCLRLPLLLCRGNLSCIDAVHSTFSRMFDCMVIALRAEEDDLSWILPIILIPSSEGTRWKKTDVIRLDYVIPGLPLSDTITIKFGVLDLVKIFKVAADCENNETESELSISVEHVEKFHEILYQEMLETSGLQLRLCRLRRINLPTLTIMENRMKVMKPDVMNRALLYLNEKALDTFHTLYFNV